MVSNEELIIRTLLAVVRCDGCRSHEQVLRSLCNHGLLNDRNIERLLVQQRFGELCKMGMKRSVATAKIAEEMFCSYGKIRALIYHKN